eukprot:1134202-Amorphochlora_amoeboformis.AAC.1
MSASRACNFLLRHVALSYFQPQPNSQLKIDGHVTHAGSVSPFPREKDSTRSGVTEGDSWIVVAYHQLEMEK